jgi:DNA polymerase delta subunit 1
MKMRFLDDLDDSLGRNRKINGSWEKYSGICKDECKLVKRVDFFGFKNGEQDKFIKLVFETLSSYYNIRKQMEHHRFEGKKFPLYESNLDPILRFVHDTKIQTAGWVKVKKLQANDISQTQYDIITNVKNIEFVDRKDIAPIRQASFDIECYSSDGSFPNGNRPDNVLYQIATTFKTYGEKDCFYKNILTLKNCDPIVDPDGIPLDVQCFEEEGDLLMAWKELLVKTDPDILYQYNGDRFDGKYIGERVKFNGIEDEFYNGLGKFKEVQEQTYQLKKRMACIKEARFSSGAYGTTDFERLVIPGRINFDVLTYIQRSENLESYKLDDVAAKFLNQKKNPVSVQQIFDSYKDGSPDKIKTIAEYCLQDTILPQRLVDKLDILPNQLEMAKVTYVPFKYLLERGQQIKVFSQIARITSEKGYLIPVLKEKMCGVKYESEGTMKTCKERARFGYEIKGSEEGGIMEERCEAHKTVEMVSVPKFKGATVLEPLRGGYLVEPITTLDFASLYPSIMRAHNMCYSTFVMDDKYLDIPGVEYETIEWEEEQEGEMVNYSYKFVQSDEISVLPGLLSELYSERKAAKKMMAQTNDPFIKSVYNGKQLALKVSMNSVYGFLAANMIKCKPIAASVTARGRQMIENTKNYVEKNYPGSVCVYGDSVTKETPVLYRISDDTFVDTIENLGQKWDFYRDSKEQSLVDFEVWSEIGWVNAKRIIRHKTNKKIYRVITKKGIVEVTEDHSLLDSSGKMLKVKDIIINQTKLLQSRLVL